MARPSGQFLRNLVFDRVMRRWASHADHAGETGLPALRAQRNRARNLRYHLDRLIHTADSRLALPMIGSSNFARPHNADWAWRPELWRGPLARQGAAAAESKTTIGSEVTLFHDCKISELTLRQLRNSREADLAPFGLRMDVFRFDGSYLSLVIDLPEEAVRDLRRRHIIRVNTIAEMEYPLEIFVRLNVKHGPNTEQIVRELPLNEDEVSAEFDLAYTNLNEKRIERAWIDLIFEGPEMNQIILRDLTMSRRPRSEI